MIKICKIGKTYGYKGYLFLYILSYSSLKHLLSYGIWYIKKYNSKNWIIINNRRFDNIGNKIIINIFDINTKELASQYANAFIGVYRKQFICLDNKEVYLIDLIEMHVYNIDKNFLGIVNDILETGANYVLICNNKKKDKKYLVPFIESCIVDIDYKFKNIVVSWPENYFY